MTLQEQFEAAQKRVNTLSRTPAQDQLLELYALFKQAKLGDVQGARPGMLDLKGRAKYDAWSGKKGMSKDDAATAYVALVERLAV